MKNLSVPVKYGIFVAIGLIAYFLLIALFEMHTNPIFSVVNCLIVAAGVYFAIRKTSSVKGDKFRYEEGFKAGIATGFLATIIFTAFFAIYSTELDKDFMAELIRLWFFEYEANVGMVLAMVGFMGFVTTLVTTFAFMQKFKRTRNTKEGQKHTY